MGSQAAEEKITVLDNHRGAWTGMSICSREEEAQSSTIPGLSVQGFRGGKQRKSEQTAGRVQPHSTGALGTQTYPLTVARGSLSLTSPRVGGLRECHLDSLG